MPFELKDVKQLVELMRRSDLTEFELEQEGFKVRIKRDSSGSTVVSAPVIQPSFPVHTHLPSATQSLPPMPIAAPAAAPAAPEVGVIFVKSPMVGTFYRSASPDSPSFVDANSNIKEDTVVCIIEAMKVMNEIQAEVKGTIIEVLVENGTSVEYGQPLFKVRA
jgi:acetyl-CoA carboxylase biotin carboxyl carrier protein